VQPLAGSSVAAQYTGGVVEKDIEILLVGAGPKAVDAIEAELNRAHVAFRAGRAASERDFIDSCRTSRPDLVLAVDSEATFDAIATLAAAREACPGTPLIVVAPPSGEYIAIETLRAGAVDYILTDHLSRLGPAVKRAMKEAEAARAKEEADQALEVYRLDLERMVEERTDELMEANRGLQEVTASRINFLASMSHELRIPLNSIIGFSGVLLQEMAGPLNEEQERQLRMIYGSGRQLISTVDDVLDISSMEAGRAEVVNEPMEAAEVVREVCEQFAQLAQERGLAFSFDVPDQRLSIVTDRERLAKILRALLDNALKFTKHGSVTVALDAPDEAHVRIVVADTGDGITRDELPHIFDEFHQIRRQDGVRPSGAGLGLSICRKMANLLGGEIAAASSSEGSQFGVLLPIEPPKEVA
jgi:signal transduction histidine kinase